MKVPGKDGQPAVIKKLRDVQKGSGLEESILGIELAVEGQRKVHYGMPVRHMLYDAVDYTKQIQNLEKKHRSSRDLSPGAEFLSGLKKEDKLRPIITLDYSTEKISCGTALCAFMICWNFPRYWNPGNITFQTIR